MSILVPDKSIISNDNGVIYLKKPEDALRKAIELNENRSIEELGRKSRNGCLMIQQKGKKLVKP